MEINRTRKSEFLKDTIQHIDIKDSEVCGEVI